MRSHITLRTRTHVWPRTLRATVASYRHATTTSSNDNNTWKVAIVGSGPSGCYTAKYLNSALDNPKIDVLDRLATPYGLVRNGVAPDHPEVKNVENDFDSLFESKDDNNNSSIQFYGNVNVGEDVSLEDLRQLYDIVVLAYGCETDKPFSFISNSHLEGILSAREFVAWYNGHVDFEWVGPIVQDALRRGDNTQNAVVIGHGNVALDCARILAKTRRELDETDITTYALDTFQHDDESSSQMKRTISVVGRRGHIQAAFTIKELRELTKLPNADFVVQKEELDMGRTSASEYELEKARPRQRMDKLLTDSAVSSWQISKSDKRTQIALRFLLNPVGFESDDGSTLSRVICERTRLVGEAKRQTAEGTGEFETLQAQLALVSIGYKGVAIPGTKQWFDEERGIFFNNHGLIEPSTPLLGGLYVAGWLKRGPTGIIGTNIADAKDTVTSILNDTKSSSSRPKPSPVQSLAQILEEKGVAAVDWNGYRKIDAFEKSMDRKRNQQQPREKATSRQTQLEVASRS
eukprot:scaffold672_cov126-Cylindrotheca_fusiformis.AAC.34